MSVAGDWAFIPSSWKAIGDEAPGGHPDDLLRGSPAGGRGDCHDRPGGDRGHPSTPAGRDPTGDRIADPLVAHPAQLRTIRGIRIAIEDVRAKFKYGGNVDVETARL